jgi:hypothetical protein
MIGQQRLAPRLEEDRPMTACRLVTVISLISVLTTAAWCQDREKKVRDDRLTVEEDGYWIYNDLPKAFDEAKKTGKPLLVAIRCIPCEACAKLDAQVVSRDPVVRKLLDEFVCVRIVQANGLDLSLFQYDYDLSFKGMCWSNGMATATSSPNRS